MVGLEEADGDAAVSTQVVMHSNWMHWSCKNCPSWETDALRSDGDAAEGYTRCIAARSC